MWTSIALKILRYRAVFVWLILAATFFMIQQSKKVEMSHSMARLLPENSTTQLDFNYFLDRFGINDNLMAIGIQDSNFFKINNFNLWREISDKIKNLEGVENVISINDVINLQKDDVSKIFNSDLVFKNLHSQSDLDSAVLLYNSLPFYENLFYNKKTYASLMLVAIESDVLESNIRIKLMNDIQQISSSYSKENNVEIFYSGLPFIRTTNAQLIRKETQIFILLAILVTSIILFMFFKSLKPVVISILVVGLGVVWSFGLFGIFNYEIGILSALIPPLLIVIGVPNCIFLINKYHNEYKAHGNKAKALTRTIAKIGNITILTNATTALGFATFILTSSNDLKEFGIMASLNIFGVFILSLLLIPIIFSYLSPPKLKHTKHLDRKWILSSINNLIYLVTHRRTLVYVWTIIFVSIGMLGLTKIKTTGNITDDISKSSKVYKDIKFFENQFSSVLPFEIIIDTHRKNGVTKLSTLKRINQLQDTLLAYDEFSRSLSLIDVVKFSKQSFYNGNQNFYSLPNSQEKNWLSTYSNELQNKPKLFDNYVDSDMQVARISVQIIDLGTNEIHALMEKLKLQIDKIFDSEKYDVKLTGTSVVFLSGTNYLVKNLFISLFLAIVLISIFMAWIFNSFRMVVVSLIPNLIPLLLTASIMGYFGIAIKPSTILVFSIAFGISVDDTIHFLAKYRQELKTTNNIRASVLASIKETGVSMIYTSIVLFFGFFIFIASQFGGTIALGLLVSITLLIAMLANLLVLPSLLLTLEKSINMQES